MVCLFTFYNIAGSEYHDVLLKKTFKTTSKTNRFLHVIKAQIYGNMNCFTNSFPDDFQRKRQLNPLAKKLILHQDV